MDGKMSDAECDAEWEAEKIAEEADRQRKSESPPELTQDEFLAWRSPRLVAGNPTPSNNPLWHWLVRTQWSAYQANKLFHGPSSFDAGPAWCFERFGKSETVLPDGSIVHIGGEHEDYYDPDFFIYNDVTMIAPDGAIEILDYSPDVFPPTDFHSATLVGNDIIIIGCLGNPDQRVTGHTPVFKFDVDTRAINCIDASGESPGWISHHSAELCLDTRAIIVRGGEILRDGDLPPVENIDTWSFDVASSRWTRQTMRDWQRWTMMRTDRKPGRLWQIRQALWDRDNGWEGKENGWKYADKPDFEALAALYCIDPGMTVVEDGRNYNVYRVIIDGITVRFKEHRFFVSAIVEGRLADERVRTLQEKTVATLCQLEQSEWHIVD
ncbi:MAG TPA: hypothetical protein VF800_21435 [Telluria sp.]|jgi:hypothetical protein